MHFRFSSWPWVVSIKVCIHYIISGINAECDMIGFSIIKHIKLDISFIKLLFTMSFES